MIKDREMFEPLLFPSTYQLHQAAELALARQDLEQELLNFIENLEKVECKNLIKTHRRVPRNQSRTNSAAVSIRLCS